MPKRPTVGNIKKHQQPKVVYKTIPNIWGLLVALVCLAAIVYLVYVPLFLPSKIVIAFAVLIVAGELLSRLRASQRVFYGIYMMRSKLGLTTMERLSKKAVWFWNGMADWGLVLGFGVLSYFIFKKDVSKRMIVFGVFSILVILVVILPYSILGLSFVNIQQISSRIASAGSAPAGYINYFAYLLYAISVIGGFVTYVIFSLAYNAASILYAIVFAIITSFSAHPNYTGLGQSIPGVAPIIPGITIPLVAGLLALAVLLVVHEFSHGILARIAKVKVTSSGLLLLGIIPIGAFVEPDEKSIDKLSVSAQNRISAAGVASNMLLSILFAIVTLVFFYYIIPSYQHSYVYIVGTTPNSPANGIIAPNSTVLRWNGYAINNMSGFKVAAVADTPGANVSIDTNMGSFILKANATGKVGVLVQQAVTTTGGFVGGIVIFLYSFFALSFLLNFLIAVVNYLPIPSFDGWRIFNASIKNKKLISAIAVFVVICIVINILPWIWLG